jgi:hypothetical protein
LSAFYYSRYKTTKETIEIASKNPVNIVLDSLFAGG